MWNDALPRNGITNWSVFYAQQNATTTNGWLSWMKPAGCSWIYFFVIASGGPGYAGQAGTNTGGTGGGSGGITRLLIPASVIPDIIYVRPGIGGVGSAITNGTTTYISIAPNTTAQNLILSQAGALGGGSTGTAGAAATSSSGIWMNVGLFTSIAGQTGVGGGVAGANGTDITFGTSGLITTGGAGGAGGGATAGNGGSIIGAGLMPTISGGLGGSTFLVIDGKSGFRYGQTFGGTYAPGFKLFPLLFSGGSGGGANITTARGGNGGNASFGGGGGGGSSTNASGGFNPGNGGNGGDALILIGAF